MRPASLIGVADEVSGITPAPLRLGLSIVDPERGQDRYNRAGRSHNNVFRPKSYKVQTSYTLRNTGRSVGSLYPSYDPIPRGIEIEPEMLYYFGPPTYNYRMIEESTKIPKKYKFDFLRFLKSLELWESIPGVRRPISAREIWIRCLTERYEFTKYLKKVFDHSIRAHLRMDAHPKDDVKYILRINTYDSIFNYAHLLHWEEPDEKDYEWSFIPVETNEDSVDEFRNQMSEMISVLPDDLEFPDDDEILMNLTTSSSLYDGEVMPHWRTELEPDAHVFGDCFVGKRCIVPVYPGGSRDTVISTRPTSNSCKWIEQAIQRVLDFFPESAISADSSKIHRFFIKKGIHVLRDIRKCGLTFNVVTLFPIVRDALLKKFPNEKRFNRIDIFLRRFISGYEQFPVNPDRGYSLGFANSLATLCFVCIYRMTKAQLLEDGYEFSSHALIGNDDSDVVIITKDPNKEVQIATLFQETEFLIQQDLGNIVNLSKTYMSRYGHFYEEYESGSFQKKYSRVANICATAYTYPDARVAKTLVAGAVDHFGLDQVVMDLCTPVISKHVEFDIEEVYDHYLLGGWFYFKRDGLSTHLEEITEERIPQLCRRALIVKKGFSFSPKMKAGISEQEEPGTFFCKKFGIWGNPSSEELKRLLLTNSEVLSFYKKLTSFQKNPSSRLRVLQSYSKKILKSHIASFTIESLLEILDFGKVPSTIPELLVTGVASDLIRAKPVWYTFPLLDKVNLNVKRNYLLALEDPEVHIENRMITPAPRYKYNWNGFQLPQRFNKCDLLWAYDPSQLQFDPLGFVAAADYYSRYGYYPTCKNVVTPLDKNIILRDSFQIDIRDRIEYPIVDMIDKIFHDTTLYDIRISQYLEALPIRTVFFQDEASDEEEEVYPDLDSEGWNCPLEHSRQKNYFLLGDEAGKLDQTGNCPICACLLQIISLEALYMLSCEPDERRQITSTLQHLKALYLPIEVESEESEPGMDLFGADSGSDSE
jgi:hypothetical protein